MSDACNALQTSELRACHCSRIRPVSSFSSGTVYSPEALGFDRILQIKVYGAGIQGIQVFGPRTLARTDDDSRSKEYLSMKSRLSTEGP
jgi:hypothetical protein